MKKKNIIWLCADAAVLAAYIIFHDVKAVCAAVAVYSAAAVVLLLADFCRGRIESLWSALLTPALLMFFETEYGNAIDSFGPMLCVCIILAVLCVLAAFLIRRRCEPVDEIRSSKWIILAVLISLSLMGAAMILNNTFTRSVQTVSAVIVETDYDYFRAVICDGPHRIRVTPENSRAFDAWIDLSRKLCGKLGIGELVEVRVETGLFGVRICSLA